MPRNMDYGWHMRKLNPFVCAAAVLIPVACAAPPDLPPVLPYSPAALTAIQYKAVLVAGDGSLPVFDNAVDSIATRLKRSSAVAGVTTLSSAPSVIARDGVQSASLDHVLGAVSDLKPTQAQGCFVFATSHGAIGRGLSLSAAGEMLSPASLDRALARGCGNAPTVVVISGCFSGTFAQEPMARANRVVLTASRADRASFGCGAGKTYTVYDQCLLDSMGQGGTWQQAYAEVQACVTMEEQRQRVRPSQPQAWFGPAVNGLPLPAGTAISALR